MNRLSLLLLACSLAGCPATGSAVVTTGPGPSRPMPDRPAAPRWDSTGWTLLGSQSVDGRTDRDVIQVSKRARYDKLTLVVEDSELELLDMTVEFANGERWSPKLAYHFRENQRSRQIDLPGDDRHIAKIELLYRNTPGGGRARVEVYGKDVRNVAGYTPPPKPVEPPPPPPPPAWSPTGWTLLGSQTVEGKKDRDTYVVGRKAGKFDRMTIVVKDSDLEMIDFVVLFDNGDKFEPKVKHTFREGDRTRSIDLPGNDRYIKQINVRYANLPGGGKARVEIYAKDTRNAAPPPPPPAPSGPAWDSTGWTLLGSQSIEGKKDKDTYVVGRKAGKLDRITLVVKDSDLEMLDFVVVFENGQKFEPKVKHTFREGDRTRAIDLPGNDRYIKQINVRYANLPGGGKARVEIYGIDTRNKPTAPTPVPPVAESVDWKGRGFTLVGSQSVEGKKDRDIYNVGRKTGRMDVLVVAVKGSDLEMLDFVVHFEDGTNWSPKLTHRFKEGAFSRQIDLPGSDRWIKNIEVKYANLPGGGKAYVEIWGKDTKQGRDPKKPR